MKSYWKVLLLGILIVLAAGTQYILVHRRGNTLSSPVPLSASTTMPIAGVSDPSGSGYEIHQLPLPKSTNTQQEAPNIEALVAEVVPKNDYEKSVLSNLSLTAAGIKKDPQSYTDWLQAGIDLKQLGKYEAARDVFLYSSVLAPSESVPQGDLGSLYHLYLRDFPKSEAAYRKAITIDPRQPEWYRGLYDLYRYSYKKDTNLWEQTLKEGAAQTQNAGLFAVLAGRYADLKRFPEAVAAYSSAIAIAEKDKDSALVDRLIGFRAAAQAEIK